LHKYFKGFEYFLFIFLSMMVNPSTVLPFYQIVRLYLLLLESIIEKNSMAVNIKEVGNYLEKSFFNPNVLTT